MVAPAPALFDLVGGRPLHDVGPDLAASALEHRLDGLLFSRIQSGELTLPTEDSQALMLADIATTVRHRHLWRSANSATMALADIGVRSIAIKGVAEEARWYDRIGERPCGDVDLVIAPDDLDRIGDILAVLCPDHPAAADVINLVRTRQLQHIDIEWDGAPLDLHFDALKLGLWTRQSNLLMDTTTTVSGPDGAALTVLAPELALVGFLTHLNKDRFSYLGAFGDVARIATSPDLDWDLARRFVNGEAQEVPVWKSLAVVVDAMELDLDVPALTGWRSRLWDRLWPSSTRLLGHEGRTSRRQRQAWMPLLTTGRWPEVLREGRRRLSPPKALLDLHQPELQGHTLLRRMTLDRVRDA